jgi:hypothetical protein
MPFKRGQFVTYIDDEIQEVVVIDEVLDDDQYSVRWVGGDETFVVDSRFLSE